MKFFLAFVFALGCAANVAELRAAHFAIKHVVAHAHRKLDATSDAVDKCLDDATASLPAECITMAKSATDSAEVMKMTNDMVVKMCAGGSDSCASKLAAMYKDSIIPCAKNAIMSNTGVTNDVATAGLDKIGDMIGGMMCIKDTAGNFCLPKMAAIGASMNVSMAPGQMPDINKVMGQMCEGMACLGSCLNSMMKMITDMMGASGVPAGSMPDLSGLMSLMCGGVTCSTKSSVGATTPFVFLTALLAMAAQLFAR
jgi:hypothetical protein